MAQEIYHRSNWGNPTETWGNSYLNADLTNELYKRASEYENSWVTDQLLNGVGIKPSIILTPTAYEDGVLNSVKPAKTFGSNLIDYDNLTYGSGGWSLVGSKWVFDDATNGYLVIDNIDVEVGQKYQVTVNISISSGNANFRIVSGNSQTILFNYTDFADGETKFETTVSGVDGTLQRLFAVTSLTDNSFTLNSISVKKITAADFDFTRGSSATRVNEKGLVQDVQLLSGELVQNGDFEQIGSEIITNGDFSENGVVSNTSYALGWRSPDSDISITSNELVITNGASVGGRVYATDSVSSSSVVTSGKIYKLVYTVTENNDNATILYHTGGSYVTATNTVGTHTIYYKAGGTIFILRNNTANTTVKIDNVSVKEVGQNWTFGTGWSMGDGKAVSDGSANNALAQNISFNPSTLKIKFEVSDLTQGSVRLFVNKPAFTQLLQASSNGSYETTVSVTSGANYIYFYSTSNFIGSIDNISVIEITDDTDLPRINYTDGEGSLLLENQSTNLVTYSEDFRSNSNYITNAPSGIFESGYLAPDGTLTATRINGFDGYYVALSNTGSNDARSVYVKSGNGQTGNVNLLDPNSHSHSLFEVTNEWKRIELVGIDTWFYIVDGRGGDLTLDDVIVWGLQQENLSYATSYIPTNGSTVTRLADVCNNSGNSDLINSTEGVLYAEISALNNGGTHRILSLSDKTNNNLMFIRFDVTPNRIVCFSRGSGGSYNVLTTSGVDQTNNNKIALVWDNTNVRVWINGSQTITQTINNLPINMSTLSFTNPTGSETFYGNVKCVAVFKELLSDTELQKLTTI